MRALVLSTVAAAACALTACSSSGTHSSAGTHAAASRSGSGGFCGFLAAHDDVMQAVGHKDPAAAALASTLTRLASSAPASIHADAQLVAASDAKASSGDIAATQTTDVARALLHVTQYVTSACTGSAG